MNRLKNIIVITAFVMLISGCAINEPTETEPAATASPEEIIPLDISVVDIMADRLNALQNDGLDLFMSSIGTNNELLYNEMIRWYGNMSDDIISDISFEVISVEMQDEKTGVVNINQKHILNYDGKQQFDFEYPLLFKYENGKWMDYGYNFSVLETDRFLVKYMDGEQRVDEFTQMLENAYDNLEKVYDERPVEYYELKLFWDREMLRQRCIPAHTRLFTGWSEPDESLKIFTGHPQEYQGYAGVIQHELVHHITIRMCNGNLPGWMLEGIAMYDGSAPNGFHESATLSAMTEEGITTTIDKMEQVNLADVSDRQEVVDFYTAGYMYIRYIDEVYGRETLMEIFNEAGKKPYQDSALDDEYEIKNQQTASEVFMTVLGLTKAQLSQEYLAWLETVDFETIGDKHS